MASKGKKAATKSEAVSLEEQTALNEAFEALNGENKVVTAYRSDCIKARAAHA